MNPILSAGLAASAICAGDCIPERIETQSVITPYNFVGFGLNSSGEQRALH